MRFSLVTLILLISARVLKVIKYLHALLCKMGASLIGMIQQSNSNLLLIFLNCPCNIGSLMSTLHLLLTKNCVLNVTAPSTISQTKSLHKVYTFKLKHLHLLQLQKQMIMLPQLLLLCFS